jgi:hypothetical protein
LIIFVLSFSEVSTVNANSCPREYAFYLAGEEQQQAHAGTGLVFADDKLASLMGLPTTILLYLMLSKTKRYAEYSVFARVLLAVFLPD